MDQQDRTIRRFRRYLAALFVLKYALPLMTAWAFAWGTAVLVLRAAAGVERAPLAWGAAGLAVCLVLAAVRAARRLPPDTAVRALIDEQSGCGGLLMAAGEQELGGWRDRLPALKAPRVRWDGRRPGTLLAIASAFVLLSFVAPQGLADMEPSPSLDVDQEVAGLVQQIALLKGESMLPPERAELLTKKLTEVRTHASGKDPARTFEAMDHLRRLAASAAREAGERCLRRSEKLDEAEALAEILRHGADLLDSRMKMETVAELARMLDRSGFDPKEFTRLLDPELLAALQQQKLDPQTLEKLARSLRDSKGELGRQIEKLHELGLLDAELLAKCQKVGECDPSALREFLRDSKGKASVADLKSVGRGGSGRGPGEAPLTWGKPGSEQKVNLRAEVLPPGALASLKSHATTAPADRSVPLIVPEKSGGPASSGALRGAAAGGGSANTDVLLPRHRAAVQRYFERTTTP